MQIKRFKKKYEDAMDVFVDKVKKDINVIAIIVYGSFAYDVLWEKSDIDVEVLVRDQNLKNKEYTINESDILINVSVICISDFKRFINRAIGATLGQSFLAKGKIIYTVDNTLYDCFEDMKTIGNKDAEYAFFSHVSALLFYHQKASKWLYARQDTFYAQYFILKAAEVLANMELCLNKIATSRNALQKAMELNNELISKFYTNAMSHHFNEAEIEDALKTIKEYLYSHLDIIKKPVIEYMSDNMLKTATNISKYFKRDAHEMLITFDYLVEQGVIFKDSQTIRLTPKSRPTVEETAYIYMD